LVNEQVNNIVIDENEDSEEVLLVNEQYYIDSQTQNEKKEENNKLKETTIKNIYDPSQWINISTSLRDLLVEKSLIKMTNIDFPKDEFSRHFSSSFYIQKLSNGQQCERIRLIYS